MKKLLVFVIAVAVAGAFLSYGCARKKADTAKKETKGLQKIHFDFDKSNIKSEYEPVLKTNASWIQDRKDAKVTIEGHCDERGSNEYNVALGDRRANSAKGYLKNLGVGSDRMSTISYGEERPIANCHDESCWWQNRRAEFVAK